MTLRKKTGAIALGLVAIALMGQFPLVAQEPGAQKTETPITKKKPRVPDYFGQIALTDQQRVSIYAIQIKRLEKIEALEKQIATEKAVMISECEGVLTETQKKLLDALRRAASESAPKTAEPKAKPVESPKSLN